MGASPIFGIGSCRLSQQKGGFGRFSLQPAKESFANIIINMNNVKPFRLSLTSKPQKLILVTFVIVFKNRFGTSFEFIAF